MAVKLPTLVQDIVLNPAGLKRGAAATVSAFDKVNTSAVQTGVAVKGVDAGLYSLSFRAQTVGRRMMRSFALPIFGAVGLAINSFGKFENSLVRIEGLVGVTAGQVEKFGEAVKNAASETGRGPQELADAMFFIASAGLRGATAMEVLNASAKAAAIGLGQTKAVADAATSAVNAYGAENLSGSEAVDVLTAAVREGKVEAERLAPAIGKAIPVASAMGIEFHEVAAAIAAMTRTGTDARTSAIQLRQIMQSLLDPSRQTETALRELGIAQGELADQAREKGLLFVLKRLRDLAEENEEAFADVFPNIRALAGALDITGENLAENEQIFAALSKSTGDTEKAFRLVEQTVQFKFNTAMSDLKVATIEAGAAFAPLIEVVASLLRGFAGLIGALSNRPFGAAIIGIAALSAAMGGLLVVGGSAIQAMLFFKQAALAAGAAATKAAGAGAAAGGLRGGLKGIAGLSMSMGKLGALGLGVGAAIGAAAIAFSFLGRRSESAAEKVAKARAQLADVKSVADLSIKSLESYGAAIRGIEGAMAGLTDMQRGFQEAFEETIREVFREGTDREAGLSVIDALIRTFAGQENSQELRIKFREVFSLIGQEYSAFVTPELLEEVFGTSERMDIFALILGADDPFAVGSDTRNAFKLQIRTQTLGFVDDILDASEAARIRLVNQLTQKNIQGDLEELAANGFLSKELIDLLRNPRAFGATVEDPFFDGDEVVKAGLQSDNLKDFVASLGDLGQDFIDAMASSDFAVAGDLYESFMTGLADAVEESGGDVEATVLLANLAIQSAISEADNITNDMEGAFSKFQSPIEMFLEINRRVLEAEKQVGEKSLFEILGDDFGLDRNEIQNLDKIIGFARQIEESTRKINQLRAEQPEAPPGHVLIGGIPVLVDVAIMQDAVTTLQEMEEAAQNIFSQGTVSNLRTVEDVFKDLENAVNIAAAEAKDFKDKFDDLTGSLFKFKNEQLDTVDAFQSFADAVFESGGSFDIFTEKGRDAQKALLSVIQSSVDLASAGIATGQLTQGEAAQLVQEQIDILLETAELNGASVAEVQNIINQLGLTSEAGIIKSLGLIGAPASAQTTGTGFNAALDALEEGIIGFLDFDTMKVIGHQIVQGIGVGMIEEAEGLRSTVQGIVDLIESLFGGSEVGIDRGSPSVRFAEEIGEPITAGIAKGMLDARGKIRFTIKELVNDTIATAQTQITSVFDAISANINLETARRNLDKAMRDFGQEGEITKRESLTRRQLERDLKAAERAMRLGQGHQEDLELSLLDAQEALEEFDANVTSGAPVTEAQVGLMQAGFEMANAVAVMKMEGDKAIELFKNLGQTMGLPMENIESSLSVATSNIDTYRNMFGPDVLEAIERAADAFIIIEEGQKGLLPGGGDDPLGSLFGRPGFGSGTSIDYGAIGSIFGGSTSNSDPFGFANAAVPAGVLMDPAFNTQAFNVANNLSSTVGGLSAYYGARAMIPEQPTSSRGRTAENILEEVAANTAAKEAEPGMRDDYAARGFEGRRPGRINRSGRGSASSYSGLTAQDFGLFF